jgi:hypothetical protein
VTADFKSGHIYLLILKFLAAAAWLLNSVDLALNLTSLLTGWQRVGWQRVGWQRVGC